MSGQLLGAVSAFGIGLFGPGCGFLLGQRFFACALVSRQAGGDDALGDAGCGQLSLLAV